jgi:hypothetical protein
VTPVDLPSGSPVRLTDLLLTDALNQKKGLEIFFFPVAAASLAGTYTDNAAAVLSTDNALGYGYVKVVAGDWSTIGTASAVNATIRWQADGKGQLIAPAASTICMVIIATEAITLGSDAVSLFARPGFTRAI